MKRTIAAALVLSLALLAGCGKRADPIEMPSDDAVTGMIVETLDGAKIELAEAGQIEIVMDALREARPTRTQSVNDQPTNVDAYGTVSTSAAGESTVIYYFEKHGRHYIEQPYRGIYTMDESLEDLLLRP